MRLLGGVGLTAVVLASVAGCGSSGPPSGYATLATVNGLTFYSRVDGPPGHPTVSIVTRKDSQVGCNARAPETQLPQAVCDERDPNGVVYAAVVRPTARTGSVAYGNDVLPLTFVRARERSDFVFAIAVARDRTEPAGQPSALTLDP